MGFISSFLRYFISSAFKQSAAAIFRASFVPAVRTVAREKMKQSSIKSKPTRSIASFFGGGGTPAGVSKSLKTTASPVEPINKLASAESAASKSDVVPGRKRLRKEQDEAPITTKKSKEAVRQPVSIGSFFKMEAPSTVEQSDSQPGKMAFSTTAKPMTGSEEKTKADHQMDVDDEMDKKPKAGSAAKKGTSKVATKNELEFDATEYAQELCSTWKAGGDVPYLALAEVFCKVEATTKRLAIQKFLTDFLRAVIVLSPHDIVPCVYMACNRLAAQYEGVEIGIGDSILIKAICQTAGRTPAHVKEQLKEVGDLGEVAMQSKGKQRTLGFGMKPKPLTVNMVLTGLRKIASISGNKSQDNKISQIKKLLLPCTATEPKYLFRQLQGKLRIGLAESTVLVSLAHAFVLTPAKDELEQPVKNADKRTKQKEAGVDLIKQVYSECPSYDKVLAALMDSGFDGLHDKCQLTPGIPVNPMLAKPTKGVSEVLDRFENIKFTCEFKYDGERAQIHRLSDGTVKIFSRSLEDNTSRWPDVIESLPTAMKEGVTNCVLDAEVVAWDTEKKCLLPFQVLSTRKRKETKEEEIKVRVIVMAFDLLYLNDKSYLQETLAVRRETMKANFTEREGVFMFAVSKEGDELTALEEFLQESIKGNCEGLMVKTLETDATYEPSKRSLNWLKLKKDYIDGMGDSLDLVPIAGFWGRGKRTGTYGAYLLACYDPETEEFQTVCKIGTGFSDEALQQHTGFFKGHVIDSKPANYNVHESLKPDSWFDSVQVWEVKAADLSISPVHKGAIGKIQREKGIGLRFPRYLRLRDDKPVENATTAEQVAEMYSSQDNIVKGDAQESEDDFEGI